MAVRGRLKKFARSTIRNLVDSKKTPEWLKDYWEEKLKKYPKKKEFTIKLKRR